jgi:hypothetical protein
MTWKSTAAASGAMLVATWLASYAPVGGPKAPASTAPTIASTETAAADIQREAERLHGRMQQVAAYRLPSRNPFQFGARPAPAPPPPRPVAIEPPAPVAEAPQPPPLVVSGIGEDVVGDEVVRTAIISAANDVHVVKVGDTIADTYKVASISATGVELVRLDTGAVLQLPFRP